MLAAIRIIDHLSTWAECVKRDGVPLWFAAKHPGTPWHAKALGVFVVAYALSPIDLIPDFIPVLGYVDDVLLLLGLIWSAIWLLPSPILEECRARADEWMRSQGGKPTSRFGAALVVLIWIAKTALALHWCLR